MPNLKQQVKSLKPDISNNISNASNNDMDISAFIPPAKMEEYKRYMQSVQMQSAENTQKFPDGFDHEKFLNRGKSKINEADANNVNIAKRGAYDRKSVKQRQEAKRKIIFGDDSQAEDYILTPEEVQEAFEDFKIHVDRGDPIYGYVAMVNASLKKHSAILNAFACEQKDLYTNLEKNNLETFNNFQETFKAFLNEQALNYTKETKKEVEAIKVVLKDASFLQLSAISKDINHSVALFEVAKKFVVGLAVVNLILSVITIVFCILVGIR